MTEQTTPLQITKELIKPWSPCTDGYKWFLEKFPQGGTYLAVQSALRLDQRFDDARWLTEKVWGNIIFTSPAVTHDVAEDHKAEALEIIKATTALKVEAQESGESSGNYAQIGSSGDGAKIGSSGDGAKIGSSGDGAKIGSSGDGAKIGSSGNYAQIGSSGNYAKIGSSGNGAKINASGANSVVACAGFGSIASAGENGVIALPWWDEASNRTRIAVGYAGENIKAGTLYKAVDGEFVEVTP